MCGHISWVQHAGCVRLHTGQERSHSAVFVFYSFAKPQFLQIRTSPFSEGQGRYQLWSLRGLSFIGRPLFNYHWRNCKGKNNRKIRLSSISKREKSLSCSPPCQCRQRVEWPQVVHMRLYYFRCNTRRCTPLLHFQKSPHTNIWEMVNIFFYGQQERGHKTFQT